MTASEHVAFKATRRIYIYVLYLLLTLDEDIFDTRAVDDQVKIISSRDADKEVHSADVVIETLSRFIFDLQFSRGWGIRGDDVDILFTLIFKGEGKRARNSCVVKTESCERKRGVCRRYVVIWSRLYVYNVPSHSQSESLLRSILSQFLQT